MRTKSRPVPFLTLNYDVMSEVALKLPAVKSSMPWRDVNSLATTCKFLSQWKKEEIDEVVRSEWEEVRKKISGADVTSKLLESISIQLGNPERRLVLEPILRRISENKTALNLIKKDNKTLHFKKQIFLLRETVSLAEFNDCLTLCEDAKLKTKFLILLKLLSFLPLLNSSDKQQALRNMFKLLDADEYLGKSLSKNGHFDKFEKSLADDRKTRVLLQLGLHARGLLSHDPKKEVVESDLSLISKEQRWSWVLSSVPEILNMPFGIGVMLNDPACQSQMIDYLNNSFSECRSSCDLLEICYRISTFFVKLNEFDNGKKLLKGLVKSFSQYQTFGIEPRGGMESEYLWVLNAFWLSIPTCLGKDYKKTIWKKMCEAIAHTIKVKAFEKSIILLINMLEIDSDLFRKFIKSSFKPTNIETLKIALANSYRLTSAEKRSIYVAGLKFSAHAHFYSDPTSLKDFLILADRTLKNLPSLEMKESDEDGSSDSEV